jgi:hypothetical protein
MIEAITTYLDIPALFLIVCLAAGYGLVRNKFDWQSAGNDESGKASYLRLAIPVCLVVSSWWLIYVTMQVMKTSVNWIDALQALFPFYLAYVVVFSGAKVAEKLADALLTKWTK